MKVIETIDNIDFIYEKQKNIYEKHFFRFHIYFSLFHKINIISF